MPKSSSRRKASRAGRLFAGLSDSCPALDVRRDARPDAALFRERFTAARRLREEILPPETTGFRAMNSEGDHCPGVLLDVYGEVAGSGALDWRHGAWRQELEPAAREVFAPARLIVRKTGAARDARLPLPAGEVQGEERAPFLESGLHFFADVSSGQKTGFFLDQRDNRARLRSPGEGNDAAQPLLVLGRLLGRRARRRGGAGGRRGLFGRRARARPGTSPSQWLFGRRRRLRAGRCLRGPAAPHRLRTAMGPGRVRSARLREEEVGRGPGGARVQGHQSPRHVARRSRGLAPDQLLLGLVDADLFQKIVFAASVDAHVPFALTARQGAGPDHPVSLDCPEGEYLKGLWLRRLQ